MKKFIFFLPIVFAGIFMSCDYTPPTPPSCAEFNASCELMKPWAAVKIIDLVDTEAVDGYGDNLKVGSWYIRSEKTTLFFPLPNCWRVSYTGSQWLENLLKKEDDGLNFSARTDVKLDTIRLMVGQGDCRNTVEVAVFCTEQGQIEYFYGTESNSFKSSFDFSFYKKE